MLGHYPAPMFQTDEELAATDTSWETGDRIYERMVVWPPQEDEELITPTVVRLTDSDGVRLVETPVPGGDARALVVCRSEEDACAFMETAGYTEEGGYKPASVGHEELRVLLNACGLDQVAMPEAWTGSGLVNFFDAEGFGRCWRILSRRRNHRTTGSGFYGTPTLSFLLNKPKIL